MDSPAQYLCLVLSLVIVTIVVAVMRRVVNAPRDKL